MKISNKIEQIKNGEIIFKTIQITQIPSPIPRFNFRRLEWLVFQSPIVRIFLEVLNIIVYLEIDSRASLFFQLSNLIGIVSLFIGSYGSYMVIPAGSALLTEYR